MGIHIAIHLVTTQFTKREVLAVNSSMTYKTYG